MSQCCEEFLFTWHIKNYSLCDRSKVVSPTFQANNLHESGWIIILCPSGGCRSEKSVYLCLERTSAGEFCGRLAITFSFEICIAKDEVFASSEKKETEFTKNMLEACPNFMSVKELDMKMQNSLEDRLTIRCLMRMQKRDTTEKHSKRSCSVATEVGINSFSFCSSFRYPISSHWTTTKLFPINEETELTIAAKPSENNFFFEIKLTSKYYDIFLPVKCAVILLNEYSMEKLSCSNFFTFEKVSNTWRFPFAMGASEFYNNGFQHFLKFDFSVSNGLISHKYIDDTEHLSSPDPSSKNVTATDNLINDLRAMLISKENSDVSFKVENEMISAHKCILTSRSPVFSAMFKQKMIELQTGVIEVSDVNVQTLKLFLEFLYTGEVENLDCGTASDLLLVAEKYQVFSLKEKCSDFLRSRLDCGNACHIVTMADLVGCQNLKISAINYIKENSTEILGTHMWLEWIKKNSVLCSEILYSLSLELKTLKKKIKN